MARKYILLFVLVIGFAITEANELDLATDPHIVLGKDESSLLRKFRAPCNHEVPEVRLFYESQCLGCRRFDSTYFAKLVSALGPYLHIHTYPYGKASTTIHYNGSVEFACQHGPAECYGNALHACALDILPDRDTALLFNACLMELEQAEKGSDDASAYECGSKMQIDLKEIKECVKGDRGCGSQMQIDLKEIKECVKGDRGVKLLQRIGEESVGAQFTSLPHLLINGEHWAGAPEDLIKDVCAAFTHPPEPCKDAVPI